MYGAAIERIKVRFAGNLKPICADNISTNSNIRSAQWNNVVFVCDTADKSTKTYVNGVLIATANVIDVITGSGFTIADDGMIYTSSGAAVKNISYCFNDVRADVVKAGTYSFDDGIVYDESIVAILNKYNAKATFNINGGRLMNNFKNSIYGTTESEKLAYINNLYSGHEIANHTYLHKSCVLMEGETSTNSNGDTLNGISPAEAIEDITLNTAYINENIGAVTRGIAWPNGYPQHRTDYAQLKQGAMADGHVYARNKENGSYALPTDWMEWNATAHIKNAASAIDDFIAMDNEGDMKVCFIWGHSYEFTNPERYGCGDFSDFETNVAKLSSQNIWLATCGEIYDYVTAMDKLYETPYGVRNTSDMTLYLNINVSNVALSPGEEYFIDETMYSKPSIACWGDSLTYGQAASDIKTKSYPAVLSSTSITAVRDFTALIRNQAEYSKSSDKYVVIGLTSGNANNWKLVNDTLAEEFGDNFLDIKAYMLSDQAAVDANITLTEKDLSYIAEGHIPQSYLSSDLTHFNDVGYRLIANKLYDKLIELRYLE